MLIFTSSAGMNAQDIWRRVGGDYREGMRASDELVRAVTGFLLGVGKAVKDNAGGTLLRVLES